VVTDGVMLPTAHPPAAKAAARLVLFAQLMDRAAICRSSTPRRLTAHSLSDSRPNKTLPKLYTAQDYCTQALRPSTEQDIFSNAGLTPRDHESKPQHTKPYCTTDLSIKITLCVFTVVVIYNNPTVSHTCYGLQNGARVVSI
jgi:hypothetical protein